MERAPRRAMSFREGREERSRCRRTGARAPKKLGLVGTRGQGRLCGAFDGLRQGDLLTQADFISIHTNLTPETRHLFSTEQFRRMKPSAVLVNTSRGPVVDEVALADALASGEIFAAGLDVFEKEPEVTAKLLDLENAVVIPHLGSATIDTRDAMGNLAVDNVFAALDGTRPPTLLNPEAFTG